MSREEISLAKIQHYVPRDSPSPPDSVVRYRALSEYEKKRQGEDHNKQESTQDYTNAKWESEYYNYNSFKQLNHLFQFATDPLVKQEIELKMFQFQEKIKSVDHPFDALKIVFVKKDGAVQETTDMFKGKVTKTIPNWGD